MTQRPLILLLVLLATCFAGIGEAGEIDDQLRSAEDLIAAGKSADAIRLLKRLRSLAPRDPRMPFLLAQCEFNLWRAAPEAKAHLERSRRYIEDAFRLRKPLPECSFLSALIEFEAQNWEAAEKACRETIAAGYRVSESRQRLALALFNRGVQIALAADHSKEDAIRAIPVFMEARDRLRLLARDTRLLPELRQRFTTYWLRASSNLAAMYEKAERHREALRELENLRNVEPDNPLHYHNIGLVQLSLGAQKKAIASFEKALEVGKEKGFADSHLQLGWVLSSREEREKAEVHFAAYLSKFPKSWDGYYERGQHYRRYEEFEKSIKDLLTCLEIDPEKYDAMKILAESYRLNGDSEKANFWLKKYLNRFREDSPAPLPKEEKDSEGDGDEE